MNVCHLGHPGPIPGMLLGEPFKTTFGPTHHNQPATRGAMKDRRCPDLNYSLDESLLLVFGGSLTFSSQALDAVFMS